MKRSSSFILLFLASSGFVLLPSVAHAQMVLPTPMVLNYGPFTYGYYAREPVRSDWLVVFLPGGLGGRGELVGCGGNLFIIADMYGCWVIDGKYSWLADAYASIGLDMIQPTTYRYSQMTRGWLLDLLRYMRHGLGYGHIVLAGFSAGGAVVASELARLGRLLNPLIDMAVIYEAPTTERMLESASLAQNITVPTMLVYGYDDTNVPYMNGEAYANRIPAEVLHKLVLLPLGHDENTILETLPELQQFLNRTP